MSLTRYPCQLWRMVEKPVQEGITAAEAVVLGIIEFAQLPALGEHITFPPNEEVYKVENVVHYPLLPGKDTTSHASGIVVASIRVNPEQ